MTTTAAATLPRPFSVGRTLALLADHRCACPGCEGSTVLSDRWPSWRRCQVCGCHWTITDIRGRKREGLFASPTCPGQRARREAG